MKTKVWGLSAVLILAFVLTACSGGNSKIANGAKDMKNVLASVKTAVDAGDAVKAKSEAAKLEDSWKKFEDDVKGKSKEQYDKVESPLHIIQAGAGVAPLDKVTLNTAIAELDKVLSDVAKL